MKHFLPQQHGRKFSTANVSMRSLKVRVPEDLHWKLLGKLVKSFRQDLTSEDFHQIDDVVRRRDLVGLEEIEIKWSPQYMAPLDISVEQFSAKYQLSAFLKKYPFPGNDADCTKCAIGKFRLAEKLCEEYNRKGYEKFLKMNERDPELTGCLDIARGFIQNVLGSSPPEDEILSEGRHGPGSSLCTVKGRVTPYYKWSDLPYTVTPMARPLAIQAIEADPRWIGALNDWYREINSIPKHVPIQRDDLFKRVLEVVPGNEITFVPKTRLTHRSIAIEPRMNLFLQLGVDHFIRTRLKRFGCDLDSQLKNQVFAYEGSLLGDKATLDLSMASDMIALKNIELLFPPSWINLLYDLRCPNGRIKSTKEGFCYSKLSSMGNGFTFAIESLIFLALVYACVTCHNRANKDNTYSIHDDVAIFGDDIIVPTKIVRSVRLILNWAGFRLNKEKSFWSGSFRESCGKDYYKGTLVRPMHLKKEIKEVTDVFSIYNRSRLWDHQRNVDYLPEDRYEEVRNYIFRYVPGRFRILTGPPSLDEVDTYLHTNLTVAKPQAKYGLYSFFRLVKMAKTGFKGNRFFFRKLMALNKPSYSQFNRTPYLDDAGRGNVFTVTQRNSLRYKLVESRTSFWFDNYYPIN